MKKIYTTPEYKRYHNRQSEKGHRKARTKSYLIGSQNIYNQTKLKFSLKDTVIAPPDLSLITNTQACLQFFRDLRSNKYLSTKGRLKFVIMSLKGVINMDYASISVLTSLTDDLASKKIVVRGDFPDNLRCKQYLINSGYLNRLIDPKTGRPFPKSAHSDMIFFEKGAGILSIEDNINISNTVKRVVKHLTGEQKQSLAVKSIILEICGNSIEWADTDCRQWLLGVEYEDSKVIFTVTDVGRGILETLFRKFGLIFKNIFQQKTDAEILLGAFNQKYGSSSQEVNRNKGLPAVKSNFDQNRIRNLKVLTNNVILHFDNLSNSVTFKPGSARFKGTFYQWEMTKECIESINQ